MIKKLIPKKIKIKIRQYKESYDFNKLQSISCDIKSLRKITLEEIFENFNSLEIKKDYDKVSKIINNLHLPENTGGVNLGDQKALFYITKSLNIKSILEIGTHIGCSIVHFALALNSHKNGSRYIHTVDVIDVNSKKQKPWIKYGSKYPPEKMMKMIGAKHYVEFIVNNSIDYLRNCKKRYDLIFLDGSHLSNIVYQEIPLALKLLNDKGIILLHDYYLNNQAIWSDGFISSGPFQAIKRFKDEGQGLSVIPLVELPWLTKSNSNKTSLALLSK